jgi:hypothetical protein
MASMVPAVHHICTDFGIILLVILLAHIAFAVLVTAVAFIGGVGFVLSIFNDPCTEIVYLSARRITVLRIAKSDI